MDCLKSCIFTVVWNTTVAIFVIWALHKIHSFYKNSKERKHFEKLRKRKQKEREAQFDRLKKEYPASKDGQGIVSLNLEDLQEKLQSRKLTAENVLRAFIAKSLNVQDELNCITEFIPNALETAKELDRLEKPKGPLHGIPFCIKDDTNFKGMDSTVGCSRLLYKPAKESAVIVQILEKLGAVPFCRTNLPQTCLSFGSDNPIFGKILNPVNPKMSPGGSSSGSGALVGAGGCPFGTGSDTGGSLRIPAHCCGISTIRATSNRLSDDGCLRCSPNLTTVPGILTKRSKDLAFIYEAMISEHFKNPLDDKVPPIPWNSEAFKSPKKLRIGYFESISSFPPIGDTETVVLNAKRYLENKGHVLVPFEFPEHDTLWTSMMMEGSMARHFLKLTRNDEISPCVKELHTALSFFPIVYALFAAYAKISRFPGLKVVGFGKDVEFPADPNVEKIAFGNEVLRRMKELNVDLLLSPAFGFPALAVDEMASMSIQNRYSTVYTYLWNMVNFPAGVTKFGKETGKNWKISKEFPEKTRDLCIGMPIGVQVIGKPYQEEIVLKILKELDENNESIP